MLTSYRPAITSFPVIAPLDSANDTVHYPDMSSTKDLINLTGLLKALSVREANWAVLRLPEGTGLTIPAGDHAIIHFVTRGVLQFDHAHSAPSTLMPGDFVVLLGGSGHALRTQGGVPTMRLDCLSTFKDVDVPPQILVGSDRLCPAGDETMTISGSMQINWPPDLPARHVFPPFLSGTRSIRNDPRAIAMFKDTASRPGASLCLTRYADLILARCVRDAIVADPALTQNGSGAELRIERSMTLIKSQPGVRWTVDKLAREAGMSRSSFAAQFMSLTGRSPIEMLTEARMEAAADLLLSGHRPVKVIAEMVGYRSDKAFMRTFQKHHGISPGQFRRLAKPRVMVDADDPHCVMTPRSAITAG